MAAALAGGVPKLADFEDAVRRDPRLQRLLERTTVETSADSAIAGSRLVARVSPRAARETLGIGDRIISASLADPTRNPQRRDPALEAKFMQLAESLPG